MFERNSIVLLIDADSDSRRINATILSRIGYTVIKLPRGADPVAYAAGIHPNVVVIHIGPSQPYEADVVDRFRDDRATEAIPVVALSTVPTTVDHAKAIPQWAESILASHEVAMLETAVASVMRDDQTENHAIPTNRPSPATVALAALTLTANSGEIALAAVIELRRLQPWALHFQDRDPRLIDHLAIVLRAIVDGWSNDLLSYQVFTGPAICRAIENHVVLRRIQRVGPVSVVSEYQVLQNQVTGFLESSIGSHGLTTADALALAQCLAPYFNALIQNAVRRFGGAW